jgi:hypothetical protein
MKTIEKIAVIWTAPLFAIAIIGLGIVSTVLYLLKAVLIYSGTAGASIMMVREVRKKFNRATWRRLQKTDEMMAEIDKRVKNN